MDVKAIVALVVEKYRTRSPYELASLMNIQVHESELGKIRGYYIKAYRVKQIYLNCDLNRHDKEYVLSHEIGHATMHPDINTPFLQKNTYLSVSRLEIQANKFAAELLIPDSLLLEYWQYSVEQIARLTGYREELIRLRLK